MTYSLDVAEYILQQKGPLICMKLHKLVYYAQAWSLALEEEPLFEEPIKTWSNGPVIRNLLKKNVEQCQVTTVPQGDPRRLPPDQKETIDAVIVSYGQKSAQWLMDKTHSEPPWQKARIGASSNDWTDGHWSDSTISYQAMKDYYSGLEGHCRGSIRNSSPNPDVSLIRTESKMALSAPE